MQTSKSKPPRGSSAPAGLGPPWAWVVIAALALAAVAAASWRAAGPSSTRVEGPARVIDGDSLLVEGREVRLEGIDAPEGRQRCTRNGAAWPCGEAARAHLQGLIGEGRVVCRGTRSDQHGRLLGTCEAAGRDLNAAMVADGYAVSYGRYKAEEARAEAARLGL